MTKEQLRQELDSTHSDSVPASVLACPKVSGFLYFRVKKFSPCVNRAETAAVVLQLNPGFGYGRSIYST